MEKDDWREYTMEELYKKMRDFCITIIAIIFCVLVLAGVIAQAYVLFINQ